MKKIMTLIVMLVAFCLSAQTVREYEFGKPTTQELALTTYPKDPKAKAIILHEKGTYKFQEDYEHNLVFYKLFETRYCKIKILSEEDKEKLATVSIYVKGNNMDHEQVKNIRAVTTNKNDQTAVPKNQIFTKLLYDDYYEIVFTFPNVQKGSILEYEYTVSSNNFFRLNDWYFQHEIPVVYSEFYAEIPGFFSYKRNLLSNHPLAVNKADIKKHCFYFNNNKNTAECEVLTYTMEHVPALEEEDFMLARRNYASRINFELERIIFQDGTRRLYAKDWKSVDQQFSNSKYIGQQLNNKSFFKKELPDRIFNISNPTDRAKAVYQFIQTHFNKSHDHYSIFYENDIKKAYQNRTGNAVEINLALVNALNAADIPAYLALSATRQKGLPVKDMAVINDFNYALAFVEIGGKKHFLDASEKYVAFGVLPYHTLNYYARVLNFKKGSYWEDILPFHNNTKAITAQIKINEDLNFDGQLREVNSGNYAAEKKEELNKTDLDNYLAKRESGSVDIEITDYQSVNKDDTDLTITENFEFVLIGEKDKNLLLYPFILGTTFSENPFKLDQRNYPIDFGYPRKHTYMLVADLGDKYTVELLPESQTFRLSDNAGEISVSYAYTGNTLQMRFNFQLNQVHFTPESYQGLKEFFGHLVQIQNNNPVILKRI